MVIASNPTIDKITNFRLYLHKKSPSAINATRARIEPTIASGPYNMFPL